MKLSDLLSGGTAAQQKKKTIAVYAIIVTMILLVALIVTLCVTSIVLSTRDDDNAATTDEIGDTEDSSTGIPSGYVETTFDASQLYSGSLILVNESNPVNSASTNTYLLLQTYPDRPKTDSGDNSYTVDIKDSKATPEAAAALNKMLGDYYAQKEDDNLVVHSASGSSSGMEFELQYFVNYAENRNLKAGIYGVTKYDWIYDNAYKYGFINLAKAIDDNDEPENANLFRYVGVAHATAMKQKRLPSLESYLEYLKTETSVSKALSISTEEGKMKIYYCPASSTTHVPEKYAYTVSGNNVDGYIITVNTSVKVEAPADSAQGE